MSIPADSVGRVIDAVLSDRGYRQSIRNSLLAKVWLWLMEAIARIAHAIGRIPGASRVVEIFLYAVPAVLVAYFCYRLWEHYRTPHGEARLRLSRENVADLWRESLRAAGAGDTTRAAHLLYEAFVRSLVVRGLVRFHPSKTTGDYVRELRRRGQSPLLDQFTNFVRLYEVVVYRDGACDAARYAALREIAEPIIVQRRAAA